MLLNIIISVLVVPVLGQSYFNFNGYIDLGNQSIVEAIGPERVYTDILDVKIIAQSAIAIDVETGKVLYKKNTNEIRSIASITKLMTALVFLDNNPGWQKEISTIAADRKNGGIIHLNTGEVLTISDLFKTALIASDNDAASALARSTGLSLNSFISRMNKKAEEFGLTNTKFADPTGLNSANKSTAEDVARLLNQALKNKSIQSATSTAVYKFEVQGEEKKREVKLVNTDRLVGGYLNIIGGKTGHIEAAGHCLAVKISLENEKEIIVVVLGSASNPDRFQDIKAITDWVQINYKW